MGSSQTSPIDFQPLDPGFAHEVAGLLLWEPASASVIAQLAERWAECGVLVFRRQVLCESELVAFSARFGELDLIVRDDWQSAEHPEVIHISNLKNHAGRPIGGLGAGELDWHSDQSYMRAPATGSLLYMVEGPADSGHTYWAHLGRAYEALGASTQREIETLQVVYDYQKRQSTYDEEAPMSSELRRKTPIVAHPLVHRHPLSGQPSLYLDPSAAIGIQELPGATGEALLAKLVDHATRAEFVFRHTWHVGDVVMWDNGVVMHRRDAIDANSHRLLKRTTIRLPPERHCVPAGVEIPPSALDAIPSAAR